MSKTEQSVSERVKILLDERAQGNKSALGRAIGVSGQAVADLIGGKKGGPSFPVLQKMLRTYPDVNPYWLIFGEGEMLQSADTPNTSALHSEPTTEEAVEEKPQRVQSTDNLRILTVQVAPDGDENIEMVPVQAAAGYASGGFRQKSFMRALPSFRLPGAAYRNGSFRCFEIRGDSMQSTFQDGDWVICRYVEDWGRDIRDNHVYVVVTEETVLVKRVLNELFERGRIVLQSDNPAYTAQPVLGDEVREVWQGVARLTRQLTNPHYDIPNELARQRATLDEMMFRLQKLEAR